MVFHFARLIDQSKERERERKPNGWQENETGFLEVVKIKSAQPSNFRSTLSIISTNFFRVK